MNTVTPVDLQVSCPASHTRYRNHFLCVASFHYTPDYSHSRPSPLHFLFPSFSFLSFFLSFWFTSLFPSAGRPFSNHSARSLSFLLFPVISMIPTDMRVQRHAHDDTELFNFLFRGEEVVRIKACKDEIYLALHDATSGTVSMQTVH